MVYGFSFSRRQCEWLGLNWQETLKQIASYNKLSKIRLSLYWHEVEKEENKYDFSQIKSEVELAQNLGFEIILNIGMKAQRWPEYFLPEYINTKLLPKGSDVSLNDRIKDRTLKFIEQSIITLKDFSSIKSWQIENEPLDKSGPNNWRISAKFLQEEIDLAKNLDPQRPMLITLWGNDLQKRDLLPTVLKLQNIDSIGFDFYPKSPLFKWLYIGPDVSLSGIKGISHVVKQKGFSPIITELQAEPWEKFDWQKTPSLIKSVSIAQIQSNISNYSRLDFDEIYLWGAEYWIWAKIEAEIINLL
jgi:hypothetical protein